MIFETNFFRQFVNNPLPQMLHGARGGICIQHLPPKWRWQLPGRCSSPQNFNHLFIYDFLGFPMCFLCVSLLLHVFSMIFVFFSSLFPGFSACFPHASQAQWQKHPSESKNSTQRGGKLFSGPRGHKKNGICMRISCSLWEINRLQWSLNWDLIGFRDVIGI